MFDPPPHPPSLDPVAPLRARLQAFLDRFLDHQRAILAHASPDLPVLVETAATLVQGGKRLRPAFCYWGWRGAGTEDDDTIIAAGAALELFHASALVHDDLIDAADTRRGTPSAHRQYEARHRDAAWDGDPRAFGLAAAVLIGDLLLGWSDEVLSGLDVEAARLRAGRAVFEGMRTEVGGGQFLDVLEQASGGQRLEGQSERAMNVLRFKSARYSVEHPLVIGGSLAGASPGLLDDFRRYGRSLGEAFQLRDDVLGVFGDPAVTGKPAGDDVREGKRTVLVAYALESASPAQADTIIKRLGDPAMTSEGLDEFRAVLNDTGARERVEALVTRLADEAALTVAGSDVTEEARAALSSLIDLATTRAS